MSIQLAISNTNNVLVWMCNMQMRRAQQEATSRSASLMNTYSLIGAVLHKYNIIASNWKAFTKNSEARGKLKVLPVTPMTMLQPMHFYSGRKYT